MWRSWTDRALLAFSDSVWESFLTIDGHELCIGAVAERQSSDRASEVVCDKCVVCHLRPCYNVGLMFYSSMQEVQNNTKLSCRLETRIRHHTPTYKPFYAHAARSEKGAATAHRSTSSTLRSRIRRLISTRIGFFCDVVQLCNGLTNVLSRPEVKIFYSTPFEPQPTPRKVDLAS